MLRCLLFAAATHRCCVLSGTLVRSPLLPAAQMTADLRIRVVDDARAAIKQFGVNDGIHEGYVGWIGFLRMITKKPWKNHLPENIQNKLPVVTIQLQRQIDEAVAAEKEHEKRQEVAPRGLSWLHTARWRPQPQP